MTMPYIRWQAAQPNRYGRRIGIFALANGLAKNGELSEEDWAWWRSSNDWFNEAYPDPTAVDPDVYNAAIHPGAVAYFKTTAGHLLERVSGYLDLLDRYGVEYECLQTDSPGRIIYCDAVQIVATKESS